MRTTSLRINEETAAVLRLTLTTAWEGSSWYAAVISLLLIICLQGIILHLSDDNIFVLSECTVTVFYQNMSIPLVITNGCCYLLCSSCKMRIKDLFSPTCRNEYNFSYAKDICKLYL
ncbi:hypothetical protein SETIT_6G073500v2 [Setaria italica]|uniref:Uncharacterized protein n=1 Tax=Setaria italica TaxID=4555 RepID=A0A368RJ71_SETIT|nr:hypothetical protein SETIT_6G073500v2 [Setaria italica]